ncbi:hypothetical protein ABPG72_014015 [Tetrahymena utriculariae]
MLPTEINFLFTIQIYTLNLERSTYINKVQNKLKDTVYLQEDMNYQTNYISLEDEVGLSTFLQFFYEKNLNLKVIKINIKRISKSQQTKKQVKIEFCNSLVNLYEQIELSYFEKGAIIGFKLAGTYFSQVQQTLKQHNLRGNRQSDKILWESWQENKDNLLKDGKASNRTGTKKKIKPNSLNYLKEYIRNNPQSIRKELEVSEQANPQNLKGKCLTDNFKNDGFSFQYEYKTLEWREKDQPKQVAVQEVQHWAQKFLIWGAISKLGPLSIKIIQNNMNQEQYLETLKSFFSEFKKVDQSQFYFQHDNAKPHQGKIIKQYFEQQNIKVLPWVSQSPDINPIERVWSLLKWKVNKNIGSNKDLGIQGLFKNYLLSRQRFIKMDYQLPQFNSKLIEQSKRANLK